MDSSKSKQNVTAIARVPVKHRKLQHLRRQNHGHFARAGAVAAQKAYPEPRPVTTRVTRTEPLLTHCLGNLAIECFFCTLLPFATVTTQQWTATISE